LRFWNDASGAGVIVARQSSPRLLEEEDSVDLPRIPEDDLSALAAAVYGTAGPASISTIMHRNFHIDLSTEGSTSIAMTIEFLLRYGGMCSWMKYLMQRDWLSCHVKLPNDVARTAQSQILVRLC